MKDVVRILAITAICCSVTVFDRTVAAPVGHCAKNDTENCSEPNNLLEVECKWKREEHLNSVLIDRIDSQNIRENLRYLSEKPLLAASPRDEEIANYIRDKFEEAGFDTAQLVPYDFFLTKPDPQNPNKISLVREREKIFESSHQEIPIHEDDEDPNFIDAFSAFTPAGTVETEPGVGVVYVNYGRLEDFEMLVKLGVNISGHIAFVRYGKIYRGNKIYYAEKFGATGVILFSDPEDVAAEGTDPGDVYDSSWWLPGSGMQRGNTYLGEGDPLTPGWPSTKTAYRISEEEADFPSIPAQPIGYSDAKEILIRLGGDDAPEEWQGGFKNFTYKLGPFFNEENNDVSLTLSTHNSGKIEKNYNVIGIIKGSVEPDRYVLFGNHRDAWGYGALDPSSGTAQLLETARVYGTLLEEGWRPRRTVVFCSWGAEEYGLIGSTEWVEENINKLQSRAVAYVNTDICASGPMLYVRASPLMRDMVFELTKMIPGVVDSSKTLFQEWVAYSHRLKPDASEHPLIRNLGKGSDYAPFTSYAGIPAVDFWFRRDEVKYNISIYPTYHTGYETFYMMDSYIDPGFKIHQGCGRLVSLTLKYFSDASILPYSIQRLPNIMLTNLKKFSKREKLIEIYDKYEELENSVKRLEEATVNFENNLKDAPQMSHIYLRALNDQMMKLEQIFIIPEGLPGRSAVRNALFSPSQFDSYSSEGFPGLTDLLHRFEELEGEEKEEREKMIKRHISDLTIMTDRAVNFLSDVYLI